MKSLKQLLVLVTISVAVEKSYGATRVTLYPGIATRLSCKGKLILSGPGDLSLIHKEALPHESGCGMYVWPLKNSGSTNIQIETSAQSCQVIFTVAQKQPKGGVQDKDSRISICEGEKK